MKRRENWDCALVAWGETVNGAAFEWGKTACESLVKSAVRAMYDGQPLVGVPRYTTEDGARTAMGKLGDICAYLRARGAERHKLGFARSGNILIMPGVDRDSPRLALVIYPGTAITSDPENGVFLTRLTDLRKRTSAWRLP